MFGFVSYLIPGKKFSHILIYCLINLYELFHNLDKKTLLVLN